MHCVRQFLIHFLYIDDTYIHIHIFKHTHLHNTLIHTRTHTYTRIHIHTPTYTHVYTHMYILTHWRAAIDLCCCCYSCKPDRYCTCSDWETSWCRTEGRRGCSRPWRSGSLSQTAPARTRWPRSPGTLLWTKHAQCLYIDNTI